MLFCYSPESLQDNWLHDALVEILKAGMNRLNQGLPVVDWPECIPPARREALSSRGGLRDRLIAFFTAYETLSPAGRADVASAMTSQNSFPDVFNGVFRCMRLSELPEAVRVPVKNVFEFAFSLLGPLGLRDKHYKAIYDRLPARICPFCGIENLEAPGMPRENLDHYLPISLYPFAGSNLRNLSPMGARCNTSFKLKLDVTIDEDTGLKRRCSDPYNGPCFEVSLANSQPFEGDVIDYLPCPAWQIEFGGLDAEAATTWNSVFRISDRYKNSHLNPDFRGWTAHFAGWCRVLNIPVSNTVELRAALDRYTESTIQEGFADRAFLKRAVFRMLRDKCSDSVEGVRLVAWFIDLVEFNA